jgi:acetyltransferase
VYGIVNLNADPDNERAEYSIIVDRELMRCGLGMGLMKRIIDHARRRNIGEIYGEVLQENQAMLQLDKALGFSIHRPPDDPSLRHVTLKL